MADVIDFYREKNKQIKEGKIEGEYSIEQNRYLPDSKSLIGVWQQLPIIELRDCKSVLVKSTFINSKTKEPEYICYSVVESIPLCLDYWNNGHKDHPEDFKNQMIEWMPINKMEEAIKFYEQANELPDDLA